MEKKKTRSTRRASTPEARENQLISMAYDLAEERLRNGTATSQEITHFLKQGAAKARLEQLKLEKEVALLNAKTEVLESSKVAEELYSEAIAAFRRYSGQISEGDNDE